MKEKPLHRKRAVFAVLFTLLLSVAGVTNATAQSFTVGDLTYSFNDDGASVTLTGHVDGISGQLVIPESVELYGTSYPVTAIGNYAFQDCYDLTGDLVIPNSVISIGEHAFDYCTGLNGSLTIGDAVQTIGYRAFYACYNMTGSLTIGSSVQTIQSYAFEGCNFTGTLTIPESMTYIGYHAFVDCDFAKLNYNATNCGVDYYWLRYCDQLNTLTIGENVQVIPNGFLYQRSSFTGGLVIPNSVTSIGENAFNSCTGFPGALNIPNSVNTIGNGAFYGCNGFSSLNIGSSVTSIGENAFYGCTGFTGSLNIGNAVTTIGENAFNGCSGFAGSLTIPNSVTSIGSSAFLNCSGFSGTLTLGNSLTQIGNSAFFGACEYITSFEVWAETPPTLGNYVFLSANTGIPVYVPCSTLEAYQNASGWSGFTNLQEFNPCQWSIGATVYHSTGGTVNGAGIYEQGQTCTLTATPFSGFVFSRWTEDGEVVSTDATYSFVVEGNRNLVAYFTSPDFIVFADPNVEARCVERWDSNSDGYLSYDEAAAVTDLNRAFRYNDDITSFNELQYFTGLTSFNSYEFYNCDNLASVILPESLTTISYSAFYVCYSLASVVIPESVTYIDGWAFAECYSLNSITLQSITPPEVSGDCPFCYIDMNNIVVTVPCNTTETYRNAYIWNEFNNYQEPNTCFYEITATLNYDDAGTVSGAGSYQSGATCTMTATPAANRMFLNWTENGEVVSIESEYSFTVLGDRALVANFSLPIFTITATANPTEGGTVSSSNQYYYDDGTDVIGIGTGGGQFWWGVMFPAGSYYGNWVSMVSAYDRMAMTGTVTIYNDGEYAPENAVGSMEISFTGSSRFVDFVFDSPIAIDPSKNVWVVFFNESGATYPAASCSNTGDANGRWVSLDGTTWEDIASYGLDYTFMVRATIQSGNDGAFYFGTTCTMIAIPNYGYEFTNWTESGTVVSTDAEYSFVVTADRDLVANFVQTPFTINATPNFDDRGTVSGAGEYVINQTCTLTATPNEGHNFVHWTENGEVVSTEASYSFTVEGPRDLVAVFTAHVDDIIVFADPDTKYVCVNNWDNDGDGELTYDEAAAVTDLWGFYDNYDINSFDELQYFTGLSYLGDWTFENCYYLSSIIIPNTVTSIGSYAFQHCGSLSSIVLPNSLTSIGDGAFLECYSLNSIAFPESLVSIGNAAFHNCNGLRGELTLPESIDWVGEYAFANCDEITTINFNAVNCYVMGNSQHPVFYDCLSVEHIHIGENVESIPNYAFKRCSNVADIHVDAMTPPTVGISAFATISHSVPVYVPCGTSEDYQTASGWNEFMHILEDCSQMQTQTIALTAGWNWFSTYIEADDLLQQLEASLGENGLYIESSELLSTEYLDGEWLGDLEEVGITNEQMYLIQTSNGCTIQLQGLKANPANHVITINPEWNWVGYLCSEEMTIAEALAGFVPEDGDQIESMEGYAEYLDGEWLGLETLKPGQGFLYYSNSATTKTFVFPASAK